MKKLLLLFFFTLFSYANTFTVSSYNVENLFDLKKDKSDYKEYIPFGKSKWNKNTFNKKLKNILKVLKDINSDIIALQEIENIEMMKTLAKNMPEYKYISFSKYKNSSVGLGFLSKIKIISNKDIKVRFSNKIFRPILESTFEFHNIQFKIFNNHWPSKRVSESYRIKYAKTLYERLKKLPRDYDYILLGDFNSNYDEFKTLKYDKKLNTTNGIAGINQVLNTTIDKKFTTYDDILNREKRLHYNLWLDLPYHERFSNKYKNKNHTPDSIILSPALFDNKKLSYKIKSFNVFKPKYLYENKQIKRWKIKGKVHMGKGFSDHLPIFATFTTKKEDKNPLKKIDNKQINKISELYNKEKLLNEIYLKDVIVIYKYKNNAIIKQKNDRAIFLYKNAKDLKEGYSYDLLVSQIKDFNGLKEIQNFEIIKTNNRIKNYQSLYLNAKVIDIFNLKYQNEIIINLEGLYKKRRLFFQNKSIKLYSKDKNNLPKENTYINIKRAHLGYYKQNPQIIIYEKIK